MVTKLEKASSVNGHNGVKFGFSRGVLSSVERIKGAAKSIAKWIGDGEIHYLVQTQGGASTGILNLTPEALEAGFNVQILSHFLIPYLLISLPEPVLRKGAQICNIARPGEKNRNIDFDDFLCLKALETGTFRLWRDPMKYFFMMDLFTHEFNVRFPDTHTTHVFPGTVGTLMFRHPTVPWWAQMVFQVLMLIPFLSRSPKQYADVAVWEIASEEANALHRTFWDEYGREVDVDQRVKTDSEIRIRVWDKLLQLSKST